MTNLYPKGPQQSYPHLTTPKSSYKRHVLIASGALLLFIILYFGLSSWLVYQSYSLFKDMLTGGKGGILNFIIALLSGFLGVFMFKALFFSQKKDKSEDSEIRKEEHPELFNFIYKVADDVKAPRPHKIYLSNRVNASVFYDISIMNLVFPTKKNLEIGLGLVNILDLGEFKSIVAHEFGHFTQRSMLIGRWVYIAHQIAYQIVAKRDAFDTVLNTISRVDIRIAWIGWVLSILVWCIRSVSETLFDLVLLTQRALSREMEFHADLVAVSVTGSDALVHSLYKLQAADEAYEQAIDFANKQLQKDLRISDVFAIQANALKNTALVLNNPKYGASPSAQGPGFRVFEEKIAQAPKMWSTHPSNRDREKNAKEIYIPSEVDDRSSWLLFNDPEQVKNKMTSNLYTHLENEGQTLSVSESLSIHDQEFQRKFLNPKYRGVFLHRPTLLSYASVKELYDKPIQKASISEQLSTLYPESLQTLLEKLKTLEEEIEMLKGIQNQVLETQGQEIYYRGRLIKKHELPEAISQAQKEAKAVEDEINAHNQKCRKIHHAAAQELSIRWADYLVSLASLIHYTEHAEKRITKASSYYYEALYNATRKSNASSGDINFLLLTANDLYEALNEVFELAQDMKLNQAMTERLEGKQFHEMLEAFKLGRASEDNINSWIGAVGSWLNLALTALKTLKEAAMDELLTSEEYVMQMYVNPPTEVDYAPACPSISDKFKRYDPQEQKKHKLELSFFTKFLHAEGKLPTIGRLAAALAIILGGVYASSSVGNSNVVIYNGLPVAVQVHIGSKQISVQAAGSTEVEIPSADVKIKTLTEDGFEIEAFTPEMTQKTATYVYNVANAGVLYKWTAYYGSSAFGKSDNGELLGTFRWKELYVDHYFETPPKTISTSSHSSGDSRDVLSAYIAAPYALVSALPNDEDRARLIEAHAKVVKAGDLNIVIWLNLATQLPSFPEILRLRLKANPLEIASLRAEQDYYKGTEKEKVCQRHQQLYAQNKDNANLYYLNCRCMSDPQAQNIAFVEGYSKWPDNPWVAYAAARTFIEEDKWEQAIKAFKTAYAHAPELSDGILDDLARICKLTKQTEQLHSLHYEKTYNMVMQDTINKSTDSNDPFYAYKLISLGRLNEALQMSKSDTNMQNIILLLAANSAGATEEMKASARAIPIEEGLNKNSVVLKLALAANQHVALEPYRPILKSTIREFGDTLLTFVKLVQEHKIEAADQILNVSSTEEKGKISLLGVLVLGPQAPTRWKTLASGLLYPFEQPYGQ